MFFFDLILENLVCFTNLPSDILSTQIEDCTLKLWSACPNLKEKTKSLIFFCYSTSPDKNKRRATPKYQFRRPKIIYTIYFGYRKNEYEQSKTGVDM